MRPKLVFKCLICGKEVKNVQLHFGRSHWEEKMQETFDAPEGKWDMFNKYFDGVTISK